MQHKIDLVIKGTLVEAVNTASSYFMPIFIDRVETDRVFAHAALMPSTRNIAQVWHNETTQTPDLPKPGALLSFAASDTPAQARAAAIADATYRPKQSWWTTPIFGKR